MIVTSVNLWYILIKYQPIETNRFRHEFLFMIINIFHKYESETFRLLLTEEQRLNIGF